jgi:hypothetical protein
MCMPAEHFCVRLSGKDGLSFYLPVPARLALIHGGTKPYVQGMLACIL